MICELKGFASQKIQDDKYVACVMHCSDFDPYKKQYRANS